MTWTLTIIWLHYSIYVVSSQIYCSSLQNHPENAPKSLAAGASPRPHWGAYSAPLDPLAVLGPTCKGRREDGGGTLDPHNVGDRLTPLQFEMN